MGIGSSDSIQQFDDGADESNQYRLDSAGRISAELNLAWDLQGLPGGRQQVSPSAQAQSITYTRDACAFKNVHCRAVQCAYCWPLLIKCRLQATWIFSYTMSLEQVLPACSLMARQVVSNRVSQPFEFQANFKQV